MYSRSAGAAGVSDWLSLAAAPTFAVMALVTAVLDVPSDVLCLSAQGTAFKGSPVSGMMLMYLLMSAFHLSPWLKLISNR